MKKDTTLNTGKNALNHLKSYLKSSVMDICFDHYSHIIKCTFYHDAKAGNCIRGHKLFSTDRPSSCNNSCNLVKVASILDGRETQKVINIISDTVAFRLHDEAYSFGHSLKKEDPYLNPNGTKESMK